MAENQEKDAKEKKKLPFNKKTAMIIAGSAVGIAVVAGAFMIGKSSNSIEPYEYDPQNDGRYWNPEDGYPEDGEDVTSQGRIYEQQSLTDNGVNMFNTIVPKGWTSSIYSQNLVNSSYPFVETVVLTSPDNSAKITILSQHSYTENNQFSEGENQEYYTTYLHAMNASEYSDYFMSRIYNGATFVKDCEVDSKLQEQLQTLYNDKITLANQEAESLGASSYGVGITIGGEGCTTSKRVYQSSNNMYEMSTSVLALSTNITSSLSSLLDSKSVLWYMPYVIVYEADSQENYDKYYDDYNFIIANSSFTTDYYAMVEYVSGCIENAYSSYYAAKSQAGLDAMNNYIDSNYSSTSSAETQDKVMEMWDDVIKEQDNYILEDGTSLKTSIHNDTVAQNGNEIYVGSKAGIPFGFDEVAKSY